MAGSCIEDINNRKSWNQISSFSVVDVFDTGVSHWPQTHLDTNKLFWCTTWPISSQLYTIQSTCQPNQHHPYLHWYSFTTLGQFISTDFLSAALHRLNFPSGTIGEISFACKFTVSLSYHRPRETFPSVSTFQSYIPSHTISIQLQKQEDNHPEAACPWGHRGTCPSMFSFVYNQA